MNLKKIAASALLSASLVTFGAADVVLDAVPVVHAQRYAWQDLGRLR